LSFKNKKRGVAIAAPLFLFMGLAVVFNV